MSSPHSYSLRFRSLILASILLSLGGTWSEVRAENPSSGSSGPTSTKASICAPNLAPSSGGERYVVSVPELNLRSGPSTDCDILAELDRNTAVYSIGEEIEDDEYVWVPVSTDAGVGFVIRESIQSVLDGSTCGESAAVGDRVESGFAADVVNLRSGPGLGCSVITELNAGTPVTIVGLAVEVDGETWLPVSTPSGDGYIYQDGYAPPGSWVQPAAVAVLMYHDIGDYIDRYRVAPGNSKSNSSGYATMDTARSRLVISSRTSTTAPLPARPVILSVDDGWGSVRVFPRPARGVRIRGTYFLPSYAQLAPEEIWELNQYGEVCGHSVSHQFLDQLSWDAQWYEVAANKEWLDSILGTSTTCFAYPFGSYGAATTDIVASAGYQIAFDATYGVQYFDGSLNRWHVERIEISGFLDLPTFASMVSY
ncbi:MAG: SH3 domain-containing protein [Thermomicrobiales bacterium]